MNKKKELFRILDKKIINCIYEGKSKRKEIFENLKDDIELTCTDLNFQYDAIILLDKRLKQLKKQKYIRHMHRKNPDDRYINSYGWVINGVKYL